MSFKPNSYYFLPWAKWGQQVAKVTKPHSPVSGSMLLKKQQRHTPCCPSSSISATRGNGCPSAPCNLCCVAQQRVMVFPRHADRAEKYLQLTCLEPCPHGRLLQCCWLGVAASRVQLCHTAPRQWLPQEHRLQLWPRAACWELRFMVLDSLLLTKWQRDKDGEGLWWQKMQGLTLSD